MQSMGVSVHLGLCSIAVISCRDIPICSMQGCRQGMLFGLPFQMSVGLHIVSVSLGLLWHGVRGLAAPPRPCCCYVSFPNFCVFLRFCKEGGASVKRFDMVNAQALVLLFGLAVSILIKALVVDLLWASPYPCAVVAPHQRALFARTSRISIPGPVSPWWSLPCGPAPHPVPSPYIMTVDGLFMMCGPHLYGLCHRKFVCGRSKLRGSANVQAMHQPKARLWPRWHMGMLDQL
jgi:hypothetical protein